MASLYDGPVQDLIDELGRLPGIGPKSAQRIAFYLLRIPDRDASRLAKAITEVKLRISFCQLCFNIAEAIHRGWVTGDAGDWYEKGITASMNFYGITDVAAYLAQPEVAYKGGNANGLEQILTQKYLAFFQNSGWEAFYNQRRTGVPTFHVGPGTGNGDRIPKRFQYPASERTTNATNYDAAVNGQYGDDDINAEMWLIK